MGGNIERLTVNEEGLMSESDYENLLSTKIKATRRSRVSPYSEEERNERRKRSARLAMESRRRAAAVLIDRYRDEYEEVYDRERAALLATGDPKWAHPKE